MAKFVLVKEAPKKLDKDCIVVDAPNFMDEVVASARKRPRSKMMTPNYMREIIAKIADKYADEDFNALTSVNISPYRGVDCSTDEQVHEVICNIFSQCYPRMFVLYVDYYLKNRPSGTKLIYFLGSFSQTAKFTEHGIDQLKEKDVPVYLGYKKKRIIGRPAVSNDAQS